MDTPPKQTIIFDYTAKLRVEFDKIYREQKEFYEAQDKKLNLMLKYYGIDPITLEPRFIRQG